jgi:phenylacetic acid degradation protein
MARVYEFAGVVPVIDPTAFVHPEAVLIGDVLVGPRCYVAPFASLRGDFGRITLEAGVNVQDSCALHAFPGKATLVEADGHIGHGAILHGCTVRRGALIGMNAVVMDDAVVGEYAFVGAASFVKAGFEVPARSLAAGNPATTIRALSETEMAWKANGTRVYQRLAQRSLTSLRPAVALVEAGPDRPAVAWDEGTATPLHLLKKHEPR